MSNEQPQNKGREIKVTVDNEQMRSMALDLAKEQLKTEKLIDTLARREVADDHNDLATKKLQVYEKFGDSNALNCQTTEDLRNFVTQKVNDASKPIPAGSAPLNQAQYGRKDDLYTHHYSDFGSMVNDLTNKIHDPNSTDEQRKEAQSYYDSLLKKWIQTQKRNPESPLGWYDPNLPENLPSDLKRTPEGFLVSENEGDIKRITNNWRNERLRKMGKLNERGEVIQ
ncbi:MAG: hypothetical protein ABSA75_05745 [Candidatus Bathyarchaeia archaeon]|jgi:hypothetical protein